MITKGITLKITVSTLLEKGIAAKNDLARRISDVEELISEFDPLVSARAYTDDLRDAVAAGDVKRISKLGYKLNRIERESYPLTSRLHELTKQQRRILKVVEALELTNDHSVSYNPNRGGQNSESAAYAEILDYTTGFSEQSYYQAQLLEDEDD
jgi:hypothetical protein